MKGRECDREGTPFRDSPGASCVVASKCPRFPDKLCRKEGRGEGGGIHDTVGDLRDKKTSIIPLVRKDTSRD